MSRLSERPTQAELYAIISKMHKQLALVTGATLVATITYREASVIMDRMRETSLAGLSYEEIMGIAYNDKCGYEGNKPLPF